MPFSTDNTGPNTVSVMGENVSVSKSVKILGLTFSYDLSWTLTLKKSPTPAKKTLMQLNSKKVPF